MSNQGKVNFSYKNGVFHLRFKSVPKNSREMSFYFIPETNSLHQVDEFLTYSDEDMLLKDCMFKRNRLFTICLFPAPGQSPQNLKSNLSLSFEIKDTTRSLRTADFGRIDYWVIIDNKGRLVNYKTKLSGIPLIKKDQYFYILAIIRYA